MNADIKPILDQIKSQLKEQLKTQLIKNGLFINDYVIPFIESDSISKAIDMVTETFKLKDSTFINTVNKVRQDIIESKVEKAKVVEVKEETVE